MKYTDNQKQKVVNFALRNSVNAAHKKFGVSYKTVTQWVSKYSLENTLRPGSALESNTSDRTFKVTLDVFLTEEEVVALATKQLSTEDVKSALLN